MTQPPIDPYVRPPAENRWSDQPRQWSDYPYIGGEGEVYIVDADTGNPLPIASRTIAEFRRAYPHLTKQLKHEIYEDVVEAITRPHRTVAGMVAEMEYITGLVRDIVRNHGGELLRIGIHPFSRWEELPLSPDARMHHLAGRDGLPQREWTSIGAHFHIGMASWEERSRVDAVVRGYLPHLLAISASSPYYRGEDSGLQSQREVLLRQLPNSGLLPPHMSRPQYDALMGALHASGLIGERADVHPLLRWSAPHPTLEYRLPDAVPTAREMGALGALVQCLSVAAARGVLPALSGDRAIMAGIDSVRRHGFDGALFPEVDGLIVAGHTVRRDLARLIDMLRPVAQDLGCANELDDCLNIMERGNSATRQRQWVASLPEIARERVTLAGGEVVSVDPRLRAVVRLATEEGITNRPLGVPTTTRLLPPPAVRAPTPSVGVGVGVEG